MASYECFAAISHTGGADGDLDAIDGANLADGDLAVVVDATNNKFYLYTLDSTSAIGEDGTYFTVIVPDTNPGTKEWILCDPAFTTAHFDNINARTAAGNLVIKNQGGSTIATLANGQTLALANGAAINEFSTDGAMGGNSDTAVPTEKAVVTYTAAQLEAYIGAHCFGRRNKLINGCFRIWQEFTTFNGATSPKNDDDIYTADQWILLSDGNDACDVTKQTSGGVSGNDDHIRLDVETVNKKFGIFQPIENADLRGIIGNSVSVSFDLKVSNATKLSDIRAMVVSWDSTADTITSDIISAWGAEGANPTLAANWTAENTSANLSVTTSWVRYEIEDIDIDTASTTNIGLLIWQNNVAACDAADIYLYIANVQLEMGSIAHAFEYRPIMDEIMLCQRFFEKSYDIDTDIKTATQVGNIVFRCDGTGGFQGISYRFKVDKILVPTVTIYDPVNGTANDMYNSSTAAKVDVTTVDDIGQSGWGSITLNAAEVNDIDRIRYHFRASARL